MKMIKDGLYYKKVKAGKVFVGDESYRIPDDAQYNTLIRVKGGEVHLATSHGSEICKLEKAK